MASYIAMAMLLGGGGSSAPVSEMILQLVAAMAAAAWLFVSYRTGSAILPQDRKIWWIAGLALTLPVVQLLPLPPSLWQALPGRENEAAALKLVGATGWMPWSMTPSQTFASLLATLPPTLAMLMVAGLDPRGRRLAIATVAGVAFASLVLGALQLSAGQTETWHLYGNRNPGYLNGFQANRNAEVDILMFGIVAFAAVLSRYRRDLGEGMATACLLFGVALLSLGCLATGSRMGIVLLPVSFIATALIWIRHRPGIRAILAGIGIGVAGALGLVVLYFNNIRVANVIDRFATRHDPREKIWADTMVAISRHWPFGSGIGSFKPIFIASERLEFVDIFYPTAAHNDYLELALEAGLFGVIILTAIAALIALMFYRTWQRSPPDGRARPVFAASALIIIASHSLVDYPLRSMAIACIAGVAAGLLSALPKVDNQRGFPAA